MVVKPHEKYASTAGKFITHNSYVNIILHDTDNRRNAYPKGKKEDTMIPELY